MKRLAVAFLAGIAAVVVFAIERLGAAVNGWVTNDDE